MANLTLVVTRSGETKRFPIRADKPSLVGRGQDVDILVADVSISRHQFTLTHNGDHVLVEVAAGSRNQVFVNGRPVQGAPVRPGDRLSVGYCAFEIVAEAEVPVMRPAAIPADPAGPIDISLAEEHKRIAPRWLASEEAEAEARRKREADALLAKKPKSALERLMLPIASMVMLALLVVFYFRNNQDLGDTGPPERLDLFADPPPVDCVDPEECFGRAQRAYDLGMKLSQQSGADPATLYKAARQFQMATLALRGQNYRLPELQPRYETARRKVITAFEDARLRLLRAQQDQNPMAALQAIEEQLALLQDSKHPYKDQLLRARVRVREVAEQARREAIQQGKIKY